MSRWFAWVGLASTLAWLSAWLSPRIQNEITGLVSNSLLAIGVGFLFVAAFLAWNAERDAAEELHSSARVALDRPPTLGTDEDAVLLRVHLKNFGQSSASAVYLTGSLHLGDPHSRSGVGLIIGMLHAEQEHELPAYFKHSELQLHPLSEIRQSRRAIVCEFETTYEVAGKKYAQSQEASYNYRINEFVLTNNPRREVMTSTIPFKVRAKKVWAAALGR